jgi:hypothetical protein
VSTQVVPAASPQRAWWLRALLVFQAPGAVFAALRSQDDDDLEARTEPLVAIVMLAGIAGVLSTRVAGRYLDDPGGGLSVVAAWAIFAGALYGTAAVWVGGLFLHVAGRRLGSQGTYRRARQVVGFALAPIALALLALWPIRIGLYGQDVFRASGADSGADGARVLDLLWGAAALWSLVLVLVGIRAVHRWSWARSLGALALASGLPVLVVFWTETG